VQVELVLELEDDAILICCIYVLMCLLHSM